MTLSMTHFMKLSMTHLYNILEEELCRLQTVDFSMRGLEIIEIFPDEEEEGARGRPPLYDGGQEDVAGW